MEREITIVVTEDEARRIDERVAAGEFISATELAHAAVANFVTPDLHGAALSDDLVRKLIEEDEAEGGPDIEANEVFDRLHRYIDELVTKRNASA